MFVNGYIDSVATHGHISNIYIYSHEFVLSYF
jgi:hypothetical protein